MAAQKVRVGVLGTGPAAQAHLESLKKNPAVQLSAVAGRDGNKSAKLAQDFGIAWHPGSLEELVESPLVDAVVIALPPFIQPDLAVRAFQAGKHVLCEKPMAVTLDQARALDKAWRASGRVGMINFCFRLVPQIQEFKTLLAGGRCGVVHHIDAQWVLPNRLDASRTYHWKGQRELGGGVLQNFGVHILDYLFCDSASVKTLGASQSTFVKTRLDDSGKPRDITGDEVTTALFQTSPDTTVSLHLSLVTQPGTGQRVTARGSEGTLEVRNTDPRSPCGPFSLWFYEKGNGEGKRLSVADENASFDFKTLFAAIDARFIAAILKNDSSARPSIGDGLKAVERVWDVQRAAGAVAA